jgi:hypothetical protein
MKIVETSVDLPCFIGHALNQSAFEVSHLARPKSSLPYNLESEFDSIVYTIVKNVTRLPIFFAGVSLAIAAITVSGCGERPITVQSVPIENSNYPEFRRPDVDQQSTAKTTTQTENRMLVAWFDQPDATWFFKVNGPKSVVDAQLPKINAFFKSVTFDGSNPEWKLPEPWSRGPKKPMRFETLKMNTDPVVEIAISSLAAGQDRLLNVNRWLTQLNAPNIDKDEVDQWLKKPEDGDFFLFDAVGKGTGQMSGAKNAPFANAPFLQQMEKQARRGPSDIDYKVPAGWTAKRVSGMVPGVKFTKTSVEPPLTITATRMPAAINKWIPNVIRWAGQIDAKLSEDQILKATEKIEIGGVESQLIKLSGSEKDVVGTLSVYQGDAWFFKILADKKVVQDEEQTLRDLLKSVRFK